MSHRKDWAIKLPFLAIRSALQLVFYSRLDCSRLSDSRGTARKLETEGTPRVFPAYFLNSRFP